jgi:uncharacterized protein (TIGR03435 family)
MTMAKRNLWVAGLLAITTFTATAQTPSPAFEVASIRLSTSGERGKVNAVPEAGRLVITNMSVQDIIQAAYGIQSFELVAPDSPVLKQRIDITAKTDLPSKSVAELQQMLQPLLAERFKLAVHRETRETNALVLLANKDGRLGPKMKKSDSACDGAVAASPRFAAAEASAHRDASKCGMQPGGLGRIVANAIDIGTLAGILAPSQRRPVVDQTGLQGRYDIDVTYTPEAFSASALSVRGATAPPGVDPNGPSIFQALQDQLGLKMESRRVPVLMLVIDHIEPLSEN